MKKIWTIFLILILLGCFVFFIPFWQNSSHFKNRAKHDCVIQLSKLKDLALSTKIIVRDTGVMPPEKMLLYINYIKDYANSHSKEPLQALKDFYNYNSDIDTIVDIWNKPIMIIKETPERYAFISSGPNRVYENGKGDDIVYWFDPLNQKK
jgi:hypothetical protein